MSTTSEQVDFVFSLQHGQVTKALHQARGTEVNYLDLMSWSLNGINVVFLSKDGGIRTTKMLIKCGTHHRHAEGVFRSTFDPLRSRSRIQLTTGALDCPADGIMVITL